jgi:hypothetical protein
LRDIIIGWRVHKKSRKIQTGMDRDCQDKKGLIHRFIYPLNQ